MYTWHECMGGEYSHQIGRVDQLGSYGTVSENSSVYNIA